MNLRISVACLGILIVQSAPLVAKDQPQAMVVSGLGVSSCASYVLALNESRPTSGIETGGKTYHTEAAGYTQWVVGFVNAIRWVESSTDISVNGKKLTIQPLPIDVDAIALSVKKVCESKPDIPIFRAVVDYVNSKTN